MPDASQLTLYGAAAFLLAVTVQFVALGFVSVVLNTMADIVVAILASRLRDGVTARPNLIRRLREASGAAMVALGIGLALARRPAT